MARTTYEVARARRTMIGCCNRFANRMPCDCMTNAEKSPVPRLTPDDIDEIEAKADELYSLYNACHHSGASWHSDSEDVRDLMSHLDRFFPGFYILQLVDEIRHLKTLLLCHDTPLIVEKLCPQQSD